MAELICPVCGDALDGDEKGALACFVCGVHFQVDSEGNLLIGDNEELRYTSPYSRNVDDEPDADDRSSDRE
jgi:hypothetical protein